ncbi:MAG TPA: methyltransferase domain-containing protein [Pirellulales bacterium]|nr:methyltransferase domain-containing protein [Pirellulales bacterium]
MTVIEHERSVYSRYASAARQAEASLCCAVKYDKNLLAAIPDEIIERDYGCGDPTPYVRAGDTVLDLGSGGGKVCYIAAQLVGPAGRVIGVDCNEEMLSLARRHQGEVGRRLGYDVVEFRRGLIQDLRLDLDLLAAELAARPVDSPSRWLEMRSLEEVLRRERPMIPDKSVDCVVSNCVLNLVRLDDRTRLLSEVFRVLKEGGRAAICDIVSDRDVPDRLQQDTRLWSGCLSGAFREDRFLTAFEEAGFHGIRIADRQHEPWRTVEGIEFRSLTVVAHKGGQDASHGADHTLIYRGPFKRVEVDDGRVYHRGQAAQVDGATARLLQSEPYAAAFLEAGPKPPVPRKSPGCCEGASDCFE